MAIQDDFVVDVVDKKITYATAFVDDRPPTIYTVNELYSYLQDLFDEPRFMQYTVPMSAQTPTQYTLINKWFMDNESMKALYGGSIQTSGWTYTANDGITAVRYGSATVAPDSTDIGKAVTGVTSGATGVILAVDATRQVVWIRNTHASIQFAASEVIDDDATGVNPDFTAEANNGIKSGESIWSNIFSVGSKAVTTEIYIGQENDQMGGPVFHVAAAIDRLARRREKIAEWWDADVDFSASPNLIGGAGHFDILVLTQENGSAIDGQRLGAFARQHGRVYSQFEFVGGVGNFVVPFASTGADLNAADGPYNATFDGRAGTTMAVGDVLENGTTSPAGRLRAVVTAVTGGASATGDFDYYLIGENQADGTLDQLADNDNLVTRGVSTNDFEVLNAPTQVAAGPAIPGGITVTFADAQADVDEAGGPEEYACTINCNSLPLSRVYGHLQFLTSRGNQDGTVAGTPDTLLHSGLSGTDEAGEFYRGIGDVIINYDGGQGTQPTEGDVVDGSISGATGVVTSITAGATGVMVLTQVKGTFVDNDVIAEINAAASNDVTADGAPINVVQNTAAPFGTFAGGRWFLAQGVLLTNVPAADANNWETSDLGGIRRAPPAQRAITFAGLEDEDRAALLEVTVASGRIIQTAHNGIGAGGEAVGQTVLTLDSTIANDRPTAGWMRVVDASSTTGEQYRFEYSSFTGTDVTLRAITGGTTDGAGSGTSLLDSGAFTAFGGTADIKVGHIIRNTTDNSWARVVRKVSAGELETTPLQGGTDDTWQSGDSYTVNNVPVALVDADTVYFPYVDGVVVTADAGELTSTVKFVGNRNLIARARFSSPDILSARILPFEQTGITFTDADLTVTAIRTSDAIAA